MCWLYRTLKASLWLWTPSLLLLGTLWLPVNGSSPCCNQTVAMLHEKLELRCGASIPGTISWRKVEGNETINLSDGPVLVIQAVNLTDAGIYKCISKNVSGTELRCDEVIIEYPPTVTSDKREIQINIDSVSRVECPITGKPAAEYSWERRGEPMPSHVVPVGGVLVFGPSYFPEEGEYICKANNTHGTQSLTLTVSQKQLSDGWYSKGYFPIMWGLVGGLLVLIVILCILCMSRRVSKRKEDRKQTDEQSNYNSNYSLLPVLKPAVAENGTQTVTLEETFHTIRNSLKARHTWGTVSCDQMSYVILPPEMSGTEEYEYVNSECFRTITDGLRGSIEEFDENAGEYESHYENAEMYVNASVIAGYGIPEYLVVTG